MTDLVPGIRNAVRAIIVRGDHLLMLRKGGDDSGERFALPGGAQESGETLADALQRECREEIGTAVAMQGLLLVADYFKHRPGDPPSRRQLVEFLFRCDVPGGYEPHNGPKPDRHQLDVAWVDRRTLPALALTPDFLAGCLSGDLDAPAHYRFTYANHADTTQHR